MRARRKCSPSAYGICLISSPSHTRHTPLAPAHTRTYTHPSTTTTRPAAQITPTLSLSLSLARSLLLRLPISPIPPLLLPRPALHLPPLPSFSFLSFPASRSPNFYSCFTAPARPPLEPQPSGPSATLSLPAPSTCSVTLFGHCLSQLSLPLSSSSPPPSRRPLSPARP